MSQELRATAEELEAFLRRAFPDGDLTVRVMSVEPGLARLVLPFYRAHVRPGGTIMGPALMSLADTAMYVLVLAHVGLERAMAVTSHLSIDFLRRPAPEDVIAEARLLRLGRRQAVGMVDLRNSGAAAPAAMASVTYTLPEDAKKAGG